MEHSIAKGIMELLNLFMDLGNSELLTNFVGFNGGTLYTTVIGFSNNVFRPIALSLCAIFFYSEIIGMIQRFDGVHGMVGVELPIKIMVKFVLCYLVIMHAPEIIGTIIEIGEELSAGITNNNNDVGASIKQENIVDLLKQLGLPDLMVLNAELMIYSFIAYVVRAIVSIIFYARIFELLIITAVCTIPMAFFASDRMMPSAINFLKYVGSVVLNGVILLVILFIFYNIFTNSIAGAVSLDAVGGLSDEELAVKLGELKGSIRLFLTYGGVLIMALFKSGAWSKKVMDVM